MKKFLGILCCVFFCATAWAQIDRQVVEQKIQQLQLIEEEAFQWEQLEYLSQDWLELKELAKKVYEQNPASFNAAYNYAVITYDAWEYEVGPIMIDDILNEAFEVFEHARTLLPNKIMVFEREYNVLYLSLLGNDVPFRWHNSSDIFHIYQQNPKEAAKMLFVIERLFSLKGFDLNQVVPTDDYKYMAFQAFVIYLSQNNYTEAKKWLTALGGEAEVKAIWEEDYRPKSISEEYSNALKQVGISTSGWQEEKISKKIIKDISDKTLYIEERIEEKYDSIDSIDSILNLIKR